MARKANTQPAAEPALQRALPFNLDAERGVLGSILLDSNRVMDLCIEKGFTAETFYHRPHSELYQTIHQMIVSAQAVDLLTLTERLSRESLLEDVGGIQFLEHLVDTTPTSAHAEYYIDIVRQKALLRAVIQTAARTSDDCYKEAESADLILGRAEQAFLELGGDRSTSQMSWRNIISSTISNVDKILSQPHGLSGLPSGFQKLDDKLRGLRGGEMIVLAARPSQGKTSLAMNIAECVALGRDITGKAFPTEYARPHPVGVFSVEMSQDALALRMLCGYSGVPAFQLNGELVNQGAIMRKLTDGAGILGNAPIYVDDTGGLDVMEMRARARRMKKKYNIELIVIDYLQLLNHREFAKQGRQIETSQISANVKAMAKELNIPVIVLSQLSRNPEQRGDKSAKPKLSDLRDSGAIEQDADVVLLLRRPCKYPGDEEASDELLAIVDVAKQRNGPTGNVRLNFDGSLTRFSDRFDSASARADGDD